MARPSSSPSPVLAHAAALAAALAAPLAAPLAAQHEQGAADPNAPMYVAPRSADAQEAIAGFQLAETLVCDLVASEPDLANPVAFAIDGKGRVYVAESSHKDVPATTSTRSRRSSVIPPTA
jgi:quinoprotein glucose dehydrogenase